MTRTHTHTEGRGEREGQTKGEHGLPILRLPFIYPSLHQPPPPSPLSALSFSLSPLCSCLCLGSTRVWRTQTKECCLSWRESKGLGSLEGGVGGDGRVERWPGVRVGKPLSKPWLSIVVSGLAADPTPTSPISSVSDFLLCPPIPQASLVFPERGMGKHRRRREMRQMSAREACLPV